MSDTTLVPLTTGGLPDEPAPVRLVKAWLSGRKATTLRSYAGDLAHFAAWAVCPDTGAAAGQLLGAGHGPANAQALAYRAAMIEHGLTPATVNRRLAALRSLVKLAQVLGMIDWQLQVEGLRAEVYRDTRGPGKAGFRRLLEQLAGRQDARAARDRAILRLLFDLALRRSEVVGLDLEHLDQAAGVLQVLGKGRAQRERLTLPGPTRTALAGWLVHRGQDPGPLFVRLDRGRGKGLGRLTGQSVYNLVRGLGEAALVRARPHGLRHAAVTEALDATGGDVRRVQKFSRHKNLNTLTIYDDARRDFAGDVARLISEEREPER